ncbi:hypothetical protein ACH5RR_000477 [Cinchona calisaya]|uniref:FLZ-type domain-containing protein n=1 Tax=Cinchona calisaya TaxID=153742 RepID=A0ABD3B199_9GENT
MFRHVRTRLLSRSSTFRRFSTDITPTPVTAMPSSNKTGEFRFQGSLLTLLIAELKPSWPFEAMPIDQHDSSSAQRGLPNSPTGYYSSLGITDSFTDIFLPSTCVWEMDGTLFYGAFEEHNSQYQPHFLDSCFLCNRPLAHNTDIFMYRGNTPFCSQECRQEQIEIDEANERRWNRSNSNIKATTDSRKESSKAVRTGAVAVA